MSWLCQWWTYLDVPFFNVPLLHLHSRGPT
jgi:hypothetical protein